MHLTNRLCHLIIAVLCLTVLLSAISGSRKEMFETMAMREHHKGHHKKHHKSDPKPKYPTMIALDYPINGLQYTECDPNRQYHKCHMTREDGNKVYIPDCNIIKPMLETAYGATPEQTQTYCNTQTFGTCKWDQRSRRNFINHNTSCDLYF